MAPGVFLDKPYLVSPKESLVQEGGIVGRIDQLSLGIFVIEEVYNKL